MQYVEFIGGITFIVVLFAVIIGILDARNGR